LPWEGDMVRASAQKAREGLLASVSSLVSRSGSRHPKTEELKAAQAAAVEEKRNAPPPEPKKKEKKPLLPKPPPQPMRFAFWCRHSHHATDELLERAKACDYVKRLAILRNGNQSKAFVNVSARKTPLDLQTDLLAQGDWTPAKATDWDKIMGDTFRMHGWEPVRDESSARRKAAATAALMQIEQPLDLLLQIAGQKRRSVIRKPSRVRPPKSRRGRAKNPGQFKKGASASRSAAGADMDDDDADMDDQDAGVDDDGVEDGIGAGDGADGDE